MLKCYFTILQNFYFFSTFFFFLPELFIEFNLSIQPRQYFYQINKCLSNLKAQSKP